MPTTVSTLQPSGEASELDDETEDDDEVEDSETRVTQERLN